MSCPTELTLSIYADGELSPPEAGSLEAHLASCAACRAALSALQRENDLLFEVIGSEEAAVMESPALWPWVMAGIAAAATAPAWLHWAWEGTPSLPPALAWLGELAGVGGVLSLSRLLVIFGGQDMLVSMFGFVATSVAGVAALGAVTLRRPALAGAAMALLVALAAPSGARAADIRNQEGGTVEVKAGETVADTVFMSGKKVVVAGIVEGDVFAVAERVEVTGEVRGNLYCAAGTIQVSGPVTGNVHAIGQDLELEGQVGGSGFLAGENVNLGERATLARGAYMVGETARLKGRIGRDLFFAVEKMELSGNLERNMTGIGHGLAVSKGAVVGGDLEVRLPSEGAAEIDSGATISGSRHLEIDPNDEPNDFLRPLFYVELVAQTLALMLIGLMLVTLFPSLLPRVPATSLEVLRQMATGFIVLFAPPVAMLIIALTVIGIPVSVVAGMIYVVLLYASTLVAAYIIALHLPSRGGGRVAVRTALVLQVLLVIMALPVVGGGLSFLIHLLGLGCLVTHLMDRYRSTRIPGAPTGALVPGAA